MERIAGSAQASRRDAVAGTILRHLRAAAAEIAPSAEELRGAAGFLADVARASDAKRHEMVLLSDVLGVSALVAAMNDRRPEGATPAALPDPFHVAHTPERASGADLRLCRSGPSLSVRGHVRGTSGQPLAGATVEVWGADALGRHDNQDPDALPEHNLRGRFRAGPDGGFSFVTERPGPLRLPGDGPVGALMARLGRGMTTPAHLSFRVAAPGFAPLVTQIFAAGDPDLAEDAIFAVRPALCLPMRPDGAGFAVEIAFSLAEAA